MCHPYILCIRQVRSRSISLFLSPLLSWGEEEYSRREADISFLSVLFHFTFMLTPVHTHLIKIFLQPQELSQDPQILRYTFLILFNTILPHQSLSKLPTSQGTLHTSMSTHNCTLTCIYAIQWLPPSQGTWATHSTRTIYCTPYQLYSTTPASQNPYPRLQDQKHAITPLWHQLPLTPDPLELQTSSTALGSSRIEIETYSIIALSLFYNSWYH